MSLRRASRSVHRGEWDVNGSGWISIVHVTEICRPCDFEFFNRIGPMD